MRVQMLEYLQGRDVSGIDVETGDTVTILEPQKVYEVDSTLGAFIFETRKGVETTANTRPYKAKVEPTPTEEVKPDEGKPIMNSEGMKKNKDES